jgi:hypothetical protein
MITWFWNPVRLSTSRGFTSRIWRSITELFGGTSELQGGGTNCLEPLRRQVPDRIIRELPLLGETLGQHSTRKPPLRKCAWYNE